MARREYTDEEKAEALAVLASCNGNISQAAKETGIPRQTLQQWSGGKTGVGAARIAALAADKKSELIDILHQKAKMLAGYLTEEKAKDATLAQVATAFGIVADKIVILEDVRMERALLDAELEKIDAAKESGGNTNTVAEAVTSSKRITVVYFDDDTTTAFAQVPKTDTEGSETL